VTHLNHKIDINTFEKLDADVLNFNEIGEAQINLHNPIFCDPYEQNRATGSFIVIDPITNDTVAAGMIIEGNPVQAGEASDESAAGSRIAQQQGLTVWFTGLSCAGKSTICRAVATELLAHGLRVEVIDGDVIRNYLCKDLGFSKHDRDENVRRIGFVSQLLTRNGTVVLVSAISPYRAGRDQARRAIVDFMEVYVSTPLDVCEMRDPKDLYQKARAGKIQGFTGIDDPYEPPLEPEIVCNTDRESTRESSSKVVESVLNYLSSKSS
jgi:adenylyl-sulfate kinase